MDVHVASDHHDFKSMLACRHHLAGKNTCIRIKWWWLVICALGRPALSRDMLMGHFIHEIYWLYPLIASYYCSAQYSGPQLEIEIMLRHWYKHEKQYLNCYYSFQFTANKLLIDLFVFTAHRRCPHSVLQVTRPFSLLEGRVCGREYVPEEVPEITNFNSS